VCVYMRVGASGLMIDTRMKGVRLGGKVNGVMIM
jgi:hypothetical protein